MRLCFNYKLTGMTSTRGFNLLCTFQVSVRCVRTEINGSYQCKFMAKLKPRPMNTDMPTRVSLSKVFNAQKDGIIFCFAVAIVSAEICPNITLLEVSTGV